MLETSPDGEVFVHDECAIGPDVETDDDCTRFEWELTGPDGEGAGNRAFVRFYVGSGLLCTQGFSGIDSDLRLYSGLPQRAWDEGPGPFATGSWNRASPTGTTAGSFSFYERSEVFP